MITETREIYKCDHCKKVYQIKSACEKHELRCKKNPDNLKICHGCNFLEKKEVHVNSMYLYGTDHFEKKQMFYCKKVNTYLFPLSIEVTNSQHLQEDIDDGEIPNEPMKKECDHFDNGWNFKN